ncbi:MAG: peptidylprolyl isomerase [Planctomycetota bacterium]|jgi:hypothetical protein
MKRIGLLLVPLVACSQQDDTPREMVRGPGEPRRVLIDRVFISYRGSPAGVEARRDLAEAHVLARRLFARARSGEDFVDLRNGYSDDRSPQGETANGPYIFMNYQAQIAPTLTHVARLVRENMGRRLGDVAFGMKPGEIAFVGYDPTEYPAGFEIIRCIRRDDRTKEQVAADLTKKKD